MSLLDKYTDTTTPHYDILDSLDVDLHAEPQGEIIQLADGETDPRLKFLSHSSRTNLHKCPRKYQLYRLSAQEIKPPDQEQVESDITFDYGHAIGTGIAEVIQGKPKREILLNVFFNWETDILEVDKKRNKSFWFAFFAVEKFITMRDQGFLDDYELVYYNGKPAVELSFQILLPNNFHYRGFVDVVLQHKYTKDIMVLECKTTSAQAQAAMYKNSGQGIGYSIVLDILFPKLSSYTVLYLVYESKSYEFKQLPFEKSLLQRALWLQELLIDIQVIEIYESYEVYPMHGESCFDFFRPCEYLDLCTLDTANLTKPLTQKVLDDIAKEKCAYNFTVSFEDLLAAQVEKTT